MKDWKALAQARDLPIPANELNRVAAPLEALEEVFRPLVGDLKPDLEPAFTLQTPEDFE